MARKFRPSLTVNQITLLHTLCKAHNSPESIAISDILSVFLLKVHTGQIKHEYKVRSVEQKLGIEPEEDTREVAYNKWMQFPQFCSTQEQLDAKTFMYENDMMTADEEKVFEAIYLSSTSQE